MRRRLQQNHPHERHPARVTLSPSQIRNLKSHPLMTITDRKRLRKELRPLGYQPTAGKNPPAAGQRVPTLRDTANAIRRSALPQASRRSKGYLQEVDLAVREILNPRSQSLPAPGSTDGPARAVQIPCSNPAPAGGTTHRTPRPARPPAKPRAAARPIPIPAASKSPKDAALLRFHSSGPSAQRSRRRHPVKKAVR